jgi:putative peptide zinc metalloprotease protein
MQINQNPESVLAADQPLPRLRPELEPIEQMYDGLPYWVIKDPLALRYYRFSREEYFIIDLLRREVTVEELKQAHQREFKGEFLSNKDLGSFISSLLQNNLLMRTDLDRDDLLYQSGKKRRRKMFLSKISNFLFFRIPVYDPDMLFERMIPYLRFIWTKTFFIFYLTLLSVAVILVIDRWHDFSTMFQKHFFTLYNLPIMIGVIWVIKGLHEFGHGLTCKNYGGECHELGWLFLVFTPFLYCNVTDSWTFTEKRHRFLVTAAGMMTELIFAAVAAVAWYYTDAPSFTHMLAFNVVVACSISTVLFNVNPLLKFDGYYMLMDYIEVPNLRQRASKFVNSLLVRLVLGGHSHEAREEHRFRFMFPFYSVAAFLYRWFITVMILAVVYNFLKQFRLEWLGRGLVTFSVATMIVLPLFKTGKMIATSREAMGISNARLICLLVLIIGFLGVAFAWPLSQHVTMNFILEPHKLTYLRTEAPGRIQWDSAQIKENRLLRADAQQADPIASLTNEELLFDLKTIEADIGQTEHQLKDQGLHEEKRAMLQEELDAYKLDRDRLKQQKAALHIATPFTAKILSRGQELRKLDGKTVTRGYPLIMLADTSDLLAKVWVSEKDYTRVFQSPTDLGQAAEFMLYAFPTEKFTGRVVGVNLRNEVSMGEFSEKLALSHKVGGEVLTDFDPKTEKEIPVETVYEVTIKLAAGELPSSARPYMSGRVHIDCPRSTLYQWTRDSLLRFISPEIRL